MKKLILALAIMAGIAPAFAGSTASVWLSTSAYTDLGAGPAKVEVGGNQSVMICEGDSLPASSAACHVYVGGVLVPYDFPTTSHLYGMALGASANVVVSPLQSGSQSVSGNVGIMAGSSNIGQVGGITRSVCVTPTITASTYAVKQPIGGVISFANAFGANFTGTIQSIAVTSKSVQTAALTFYPFVTNPGTPANLADHTTATIASADVSLVRAPTEMTSAYSDLGTHTVWGAKGIAQTIAMTSSTLYGVLVAQSTTAAFGSTSDMQVCVKILSDQ